MKTLLGLVFIALFALAGLFVWRNFVYPTYINVPPCRPGVTESFVPARAGFPAAMRRRRIVERDWLLRCKRTVEIVRIIKNPDGTVDWDIETFIHGPRGGILEKKRELVRQP